MKNHEYSEWAYEQFSRIGKALGSSKRFELLDLLSQGEHTVEELANETGMSVANTSQHLQNLKNSYLVSVRRQRNEMIYRIRNAALIEVLETVKGAAEDYLAEMDRIRDLLTRERAGIPILSFYQWDALRESEDAQLVDVRPAAEYATTHLPGAISIPLDDLEDHLGELSPDKPVVVYCRGFYSPLADEAVRRLIAQGFEVFRLEQGLNRWRMEGRPVEA